jgi:phage terminase Nu1 subunit (DNA packaging protein)
VGNYLTIAEYAAHRRVTVPAVRKALTDGRLANCAGTNEAGHVVVDVDKADAQWSANSHPSHGGKRTKGRPAAAAQDDGDPEGATFAASRAKKEAYQAELARLEYEQKSGTLVEAEAVKREAFRVARMIRDGLLNLPDRMAAELAGMSDQFEIHRRMVEEIRKALDAALGPDRAT